MLPITIYKVVLISAKAMDISVIHYSVINYNHLTIKILLREHKRGSQNVRLVVIIKLYTLVKLLAAPSFLSVITFLVPSKQIASTTV